MSHIFRWCVLVLFLMGGFGATLQADPMFGETMEFRQPDGTEVPVVLFGDEFYMRGETPDGYTVLRDPDTGWICYAELSADGSKLVPTQEHYLNALTPARRTVPGAALTPAGVTTADGTTREKGVQLSTERLLEKVRDARERMGADELYADTEPSPDMTPAQAAPMAAAMTTETDPMMEPAETGLPVRTTDPSSVSGAITGLVVVVDFPGEPAPYTLQQYEDKCNKEDYYEADGTALSLRTFYKDASGGVLDMVQVVKGVYRAPKTFAEYDAMGFAVGAKEVLRFVLQQLEDEGFDFSQLTIDDDDGTVQLVSIMYPGNAQSWAQGMWHHSHFITTDNSFGGVKFSSYVTSRAGSLSPRTMCHEYGHMAARWPDMYAYSGSAGVWGIMGGGKTRLPNPYLLYRNSWLDLENVFGLDGTFQMDSLDPHRAYVYYDQSHPDEYFIMRPYTKDLLECANIPEEGMTIWRINNEGSNSSFPDRPLLVDLVKADNHQPETSSGVCFSKFGVLDHYTPYTEASSAWRYHGLEYQDSGFQMLNVSAVDSNMTFDLSNDPAPPKHTVRGGSTALFVDTFERIGGNDVDVVGDGMSGSLVTSPTEALYYEGYEGSGIDTSIQVLDGRLRMAVGNGMSENGIGHNFIDPEMLTAGGFSVQLDVNEILATPNENSYCGFGVGLSRDEAAAGAAISSSSSFRGKASNEAGVSDFFVELDSLGNVKVWRHGSLISTVPVGAASGTLRADFSCSGFSMSDAVTVSVYFNGRAVDINTDASTTQTFNWSSDHENYMGLSTRAGNYAEMDNLKISSLGQDGEVVLQTDFEAYETGGVAAWNETGLVNVFPLGDDVGEGYYHAAGSERLVSNPEANGNTSAQVLRGGSSNTDVNKFSMNYSAGAVQINGMTLSYDFYNNGTGTNATDGVRVGLQNSDSTAGGFWIRNDREGLIQINGTDIAEQNAGAEVWQRFSGVFSQTEGETNRFDFAWTLTNLETTSVIASGTQSNQVLFATTEEIYSAGLTFEVHDVDDGANFLGYLDHLEVSSPGQAGDLFYDSFARPDHTDVDADVGGISGSSVASLLEEIAKLMRPGGTYIEGYEAGDESTTRVAERTLQMAYGSSMSEVALDHNFIDQEIVTAGGFSVELKVAEMVSTDSDLHNRYGGFGVGLTQAEAQSGNDINSEGSFRGIGGSVLGKADFFVELDMNGDVKVFRYGSLIATVPVGAASGTLTAGFACSGFGSSDSVEVSVFFNGALLDINSGSGVTQTFTWQNGNANYIGLSARADEVSFDYLAVRTLPLHSAIFAQVAFEAGLAADEADPDADADGDGQSNFSEWVLGTGMMVANAPVKPIQLLGVTDSAFRFSQRRMVDAGYVGVNYSVSWSTNLVDWFDFVPALLDSVPVGGNAAYEDVELDVGSAIRSGKDRLFIRGIIEP